MTTQPPKEISKDTNRYPMLLTAKEAARTLSISPRKLWELTNCSEIPCVRIGKLVRYTPDDLQDWINKMRRQSSRMN